TGSHGCAAAADAGRHQGLHAAWRHRDQHHLLRYLHHHCRRLHRRRHRLHGLHRRHRRPHPRDHPHHYLHLLHCFLHRPLHHPCFPCPCQCGVAHSGQTQRRPPQCQRGRQQQQRQQRGEGGQGNTPQRRGCVGRREKPQQL
ncbi:unnamed protein product, partial [Closterium sp. NIES-54]